MRLQLNVEKLAEQCKRMPEYKSMILNGLSHEQKEAIEKLLSIDIVQTNVIHESNKEFLALIS